MHSRAAGRVGGTGVRTTKRALNTIDAAAIRTIVPKPNVTAFRPIGAPTYVRKPQPIAGPSNTQAIQADMMKLDGQRSVNSVRDVSVTAPEIRGYERKSALTRAQEAVDVLEEELPTRLRISTVSSALLRKMARVQITSPEEDPDAADGQFGVNSYLMGSSSLNKMCQTCGQVKCPGHYGFIALKKPVIHPVYERVVYAVLGCICMCCGKTYVPTHEAAVRLTHGMNMGTSEWGYLSALEKLSKPLKCINPQAVQCGDGFKVNDCLVQEKKHVDINKSKGKNVVYYTDGTCDTAEEVLKKFNSICDSHARLMGFNEDSHPRDLIISDLAVIPPIARPNVYENGVTKADQLTSKYANIVKENNSIDTPKKTNKSGITSDDKIRTYIHELIIDDKKSKPKRMSTEKMFSIFLRIKGKEGLIRGASQGKRVNYSARAVLSPATYLKFGELGVPVSIASTWAFPMQVTQANIAHVRQLISCDPPRILKHTPMSGPRKGITTKYIPKNGIVIRQGDIVERWAQDGDMVIFNRQPTIHYGGFLGYTVKVLYDRDTVGVHPSATTTHNADFDGDAATLHFPIDPIAIAETRDLLHITKNIVDRKTGKPLVGLIMDAITYAFLMTSFDRGIDEFTFRQVIDTMDTKIDVDDLQKRAKSYGLHPFSGRTLFSALFPRDFSYNQKGMVIEDGILVSGRATSNHLAISHRSIVQDLYMTYDENVASQFLTDATWMLIAWGDTFGFSIGPADCEYGRMGDANEIKTRMLLMAKMEDQIDALGPRPTNPILLENYEAKVMAILSQDKVLGKELTEKYMSESCPLKGRQNAIGCMAKEIGAGAKSDLFNVAQMHGSVGQQQDKGNRLPALLNEGMRALPTQAKRGPGVHVPIKDRGFCPSSYMEGLDPDELYSIAWGGRPGLIDTNLSTAEVGAVYRGAFKAGEHIMLGKSGAIETIVGNLVYSFGFGGDGLSPEKMIMVNMDGDGMVPSFCDLGVIIDRANAMGGWITSDIQQRIDDNAKNYDIVEADIQVQSKLGLFECPDYAVYDGLVRTTGGGYQRVEVPANVDIRDLIKETSFPVMVHKKVLSNIPAEYTPQGVLHKTPHYDLDAPKIRSTQEPPKIPPIDPNIVKPKPMTRAPVEALPQPDKPIVTVDEMSDFLDELM